MGSLDRGHERARLITAIAHRTAPYSQLAAERGVTRQAISAFARRWALAIADARAAADDDAAHLWISQRTARLAEYQQTVEDIDAALRFGLIDDEYVSTPDDRAALLRIRLQALRQAAEETGQLRDTAPVQAVEIRLNGVDLSQLT